MSHSCRWNDMAGTSTPYSGPSLLAQAVHLPVDVVLGDLLAAVDIPAVHDHADPPPGDGEHRPEEAVRVGKQPDHHQEGVDQDVDEKVTAEVALLLELPDRLIAQYLLTVGIVGNHECSLL